MGLADGDALGTSVGTTVGTTTGAIVATGVITKLLKYLVQITYPPAAIATINNNTIAMVIIGEPFLAGSVGVGGTDKSCETIGTSGVAGTSETIGVVKGSVGGVTTGSGGGVTTGG